MIITILMIIIMILMMQMMIMIMIWRRIGTIFPVVKVVAENYRVKQNVMRGGSEKCVALSPLYRLL